MVAKICALCIAVIFASTIPYHAAAQVGVGACSGTAAIGKCSEPDEDNLDCMGACPVKTMCQVHQFMSGQTTYWACACVGGGSATEGPCCHLIVIQPEGGGNKVWGARGNCPSCGSQGSCHLDSSGCQAVCS